MERSAQGTPIPGAQPHLESEYVFRWSADERRWWIATGGLEVWATELKLIEVDAIGRPDGSMVVRAQLIVDGSTVTAGNRARAKSAILRRQRRYDQVLHMPVVSSQGKALRPG